MQNRFAVRLAAAALVLASALSASAQLSADQSARLEEIQAHARASVRQARLAAQFDAAPPLTSLKPLNDAWLIAEPAYGGTLLIDAAGAKPGYPSFNGIEANFPCALTLAEGEARFIFPAAASSRSSNEMDDREIPVKTTEAEYRCRLLAQSDLMVCRVSFIPSHDDSASVVRQERYEGFQRKSFSPFR